MKKRVISAILTLALLVVIAPAALTTSAKAESTEIHVSTVEELENAVSTAQSLTDEQYTIILEGKDYIFTGTFGISQIENLTIRGTTGTRILSSDAEASVVRINESTVTLENITFGHTQGTDSNYDLGGCSPNAYVIYVADSGLTLKGCDLFGCGWTAIRAYKSVVMAENSVFHDCSCNMAEVSGSELFFAGCTFSGNGYYYQNIGYFVSVSGGYIQSLTFTDCEFTGNYNAHFVQLESYRDDINDYYYATTLTVENCSFSNNVWPDEENKSYSADEEYIYDITSPGTDAVLDTETLKNVTDTASAVSAVKKQNASMRMNGTSLDLATLYAETAVAYAATQHVEGRELIIEKAAIVELEKVTTQTSVAVEAAFDVSLRRTIANTVRFTTDETGEITIKIDPDVLETTVDKVIVQTPTYALTFNLRQYRINANCAKV